MQVQQNRIDNLNDKVEALQTAIKDHSRRWANVPKDKATGLGGVPYEVRLNPAGVPHLSGNSRLGGS